MITAIFTFVTVSFFIAIIADAASSVAATRSFA